MQRQLSMQASTPIANKSNVYGLHVSTDATPETAAISQIDEEEQEESSRPAGCTLCEFQLYQICVAKLPTGHYSGHGPFQEEYSGLVTQDQSLLSAVCLSSHSVRTLDQHTDSIGAEGYYHMSDSMSVIVVSIEDCTASSMIFPMILLQVAFHSITCMCNSQLPCCKSICLWGAAGLPTKLL